MSLVLRYVDTEVEIREEFVAFLHCKWGLSGAQMSKLILDYLQELNLSIDDCRGQAYDGAGSVAGHINGLSAHILKFNPKLCILIAIVTGLTYLFAILCLLLRSPKCLNM